jgi:hypothetical protein
MASWRETQSRTSYLSRVFTKDVPPDLLHTGIARLCVLYEDFSIEAHGAAADSIEAIDILQPLKENADNPANVGFYRKIYFLRRLTGTLYEFADELCRLNLENSFQPILGAMPADFRDLWADGVSYFKKKEVDT